eukprot:SAG11_NODE_53_length_19648_cov_14.691902_25_plen_108_part_00
MCWPPHAEKLRSNRSWALLVRCPCVVIVSQGVLLIGASEYSTLTAAHSGRVYSYKWGEKYDDFDNMTMEWLPKQILKADYAVNDDFFVRPLWQISSLYVLYNLLCIL